MLNRDIKITFRLNQDELERLRKRIIRTGLSQEAYIRLLINGYVPTDAPPPDYFAMTKELRRIGVNLNQIAHKAHFLNMIDVDRYDDNIITLNKSIVDIMNAVMLPRRIIYKEMSNRR